MNGIVLVNKEAGFTSFDCVAILRGKLGIKRLGHTGTLDPFATGVLPVMVGNTTRLCDILPNTDKRYTATVKLGTVTDTLDITGTVISTVKSAVTRHDLVSILDNFRGNISQVPPMYSAIKVNGQKLYSLARKGIEVNRPARNVTIKSLTLLSFDEDAQQFCIDVLCTKGTYIRSLADDIGAALSCGACLTALTRTLACGYDISLCTSIDEIKQMSSCSHLLQNIDYATKDFQTVTLSPQQSKMFLNGVKLDLDKITELPKSDNTFIRVTNETDILGIAVTDVEQNKLLIKCLLNH